MEGVSAPTLLLDKTATPSPVSPGGILTWTLVAENVGTDDATQVTLIDVLSPVLQFVSASDGGVSDSMLHQVTWMLSAVPAGSGPVVRTVDTVVLAPLGATVDNLAELSSFEAPSRALPFLPDRR